MAKPQSKQEFVNYCLRQLGDGAIKINVTKDQIDDRVDQSLQYFEKFHLEGVERTFHMQTVTQADIDNGYVTLPDDIKTVIRMIPSRSRTGDKLFDIEYQTRLHSLWDLQQASVVDYSIWKRHLSLLDMMFNGERAISFNEHTHRVYIHDDWETEYLADTSIVIFEVHKSLDKDLFIDVWDDEWLKRYCTAHIKLQWGNNMRKFANIELLGGATVTGLELMQEAQEEIKELKEEVQTTYQLPPDFAIG